MNHSNKIIQSLWIGPSLSIVEQLCIKSYIKNGHTFHLYLYDRHMDNVPKGTVIKDANEIIPANAIFLDSRETVASFSDWFRYKLLFQRGGWWVDMDNVCIKPYDFLDEFCFATEDGETGAAVNNGVLKAPLEVEFLGDCLDFIESESHQKVEWGRYGPRFLRIILERYEHKDYVKKPVTFCPVNFPMFRSFFSDKIILSPDTFSVHLWNEMWRVNDVAKNDFYPQHSLFEQLKKKYL